MPKDQRMDRRAISTQKWRPTGMLPGSLTILYVLAHEVLLRMIRYDPELKGIPIPDKNGDMIPSKPTELRERAFADDTGVGIQDNN